MKDLLAKYKEKKPQIIFEWNDTETEARGWVVINSLRGGAAGGGTRMREGLDMEEVKSLAKVMEIKFSVSGPAIGGAKSGISFNPKDPRKNEVLQRWYTAVIPLLKNYYGTGGDMNIDEVKDVIPMTENLGLWHPQEGIVNGHYNPTPAQKIHKIGQLRTGVSKKLEDLRFTPNLEEGYLVADLITGWGVAQSVEHYFDIWEKGNVKGKKMIVQGWGNVAATAAYYLAKSGAILVGIIDKDGGVINENGYSLQEVEQLLEDRDVNKLVSKDMMSFEDVNAKIWDVACDIFIPAAASKLVSEDQIGRLINKGCSVVSAGANVPFKGDDVFFGDTADFADKNLAYVPDFIANCGMARTFGYLMGSEVEITDEAIFNDTSNKIKEALEATYAENNSNRNIAKTALSIALTKLMK